MEQKLPKACRMRKKKTAQNQLSRGGTGQMVQKHGGGYGRNGASGGGPSEKENLKPQDKKIKKQRVTGRYPKLSFNQQTPKTGRENIGKSQRKAQWTKQSSKAYGTDNLLQYVLSGWFKTTVRQGGGKILRPEGGGLRTATPLEELKPKLHYKTNEN